MGEERGAAATSSDRAVVDRMTAGDEEALRDLQAWHGRRLFARALRITRSAHLAEEVVQDSLFAAWRGTGSYRAEGSVLGWLLGIVRNQALNAVRRRTPATGTLDEATEIPASEEGVDARLAAGERRAVVREALARLSPEHRDVLRRVFFDGLSLAETARACGCPVGTVKSRLHAAKARLRERLDEGGGEVE